MTQNQDGRFGGRSILGATGFHRPRFIRSNFLEVWSRLAFLLKVIDAAETAETTFRS
jgi:hypothetical protein